MYAQRSQRGPWITLDKVRESLDSQLVIGRCKVLIGQIVEFPWAGTAGCAFLPGGLPLGLRRSSDPAGHIIQPAFGIAQALFYHSQTLAQLPDIHSEIGAEIIQTLHPLAEQAIEGGKLMLHLALVLLDRKNLRAHELHLLSRSPAAAP